MIRDDLFSAIRETPCIDIHNRLRGQALCAESLGQVMFHPHVCCALRAAGVEEALLWPGGEDDSAGSFTPYAGFCEAWPDMANTGVAWVLRTMLRELYGFDEPFCMDAIGRLEQSFADHTVQGDWGVQILKRAGLERLLTTQPPELAAAGPDAGLRCVAEISLPPAGPREDVTWATWLRRLADLGQADIRSLADLHGWCELACRDIDAAVHRAAGLALRGMTDFAPVEDLHVDALIQLARNGEVLAPAQEGMLQAAAVRCLCRAIQGQVPVLQLRIGSSCLHEGPHTIARTHPQFAAGLAHLLTEFPDLHFMIINAHEPSEPTLCTLTQAYANVSLGGVGAAMLNPASMQAAWRRRLDMVPAGRLCGLASGAGCGEWVYGLLQLTRRVLASVLSEKVDHGFYGTVQATDIAQQILLDTPARLLLPGERV